MPQPAWPLIRSDYWLIPAIPALYAAAYYAGPWGAPGAAAYLAAWVGAVTLACTSAGYHHYAPRLREPERLALPEAAPEPRSLRPSPQPAASPSAGALRALLGQPGYYLRLSVMGAVASAAAFVAFLTFGDRWEDYRPFVLWSGASSPLSLLGAVAAGVRLWRRRAKAEAD